MNIAITTKLESAKERFHESVESRQSSVLKRKAGRQRFRE